MSNPTEPSRSYKPTRKFLSVWAPSCLIAIAAFAVYLPSLRDAFLIDDGRYVANNPIIDSSNGLYRFWFTSEALDYYPVSNTSLWIEWRLWGATRLVTESQI